MSREKGDHNYFGGARSKGFATLRNVSKLQFLTRLVQGDLSWPSLSMKKTQLLSQFALELKAVSYFSADLYLIAQTIGGNHD